MSQSLRGCALYFDCFSGISGDMTLGALLDLGVPEEFVRGELAKLKLGGYRLERKRVMRGALAGTKINVLVDDHDHHHDHDHRDHDHHDHGHGKHEHSHGHIGHEHRHYKEIRDMLNAGLSGDVLSRSLAMFDRIAQVEARLHGVSVDEVAFHEVGAVDSIVDIVGAAAALSWLSPSQIISRRVPLGGGTVQTAHGLLPVPAPATLELLRNAEVEAEGATELTTPTGAAILAANAQSYGPLPPMNVQAVGWGAGDRELADRPNLLRVVVGKLVAKSTTESLVVIEANIDDMNPLFAEPLLEALFAAGALDAWLTPITMKKGRPALLVSALCGRDLLAQVETALLKNSTTLGVRHHAVDRTVLERRFVEVATPYGTVPIKIGTASDGSEYNAAPEYEVCARLAKERGVPVKEVFASAIAAYRAKR